MNNLVFNLAYKIKKIHKETIKLYLEAKKTKIILNAFFFHIFTEVFSLL
jgi:hypothetical protein